MKLSEILKDWPEKKDGNKFEDYGVCDWEDFTGGFNTALTSCDREIDREALINEIRVFRNRTYAEFNSIDFADHIISTMPTWLKPIERK